MRAHHSGLYVTPEFRLACVSFCVYSNAYRNEWQERISKLTIKPEESGRLVGYARVSTQEQCLDMQRDALIKHGVDPKWIFSDEMSGKSMERPGLRNALRIMRPGNVLVVWKLDRLGRSLLGVLNTLEMLRGKQMEFRSLTEAFDTTTPIGDAMMKIALVFAQLERDMISERTKTGVRRAMERGVKFGREAAMTPLRIAEYKRLISLNPDMTKRDIVAALQSPEFTPPTISINSFYNWQRKGMPGLEQHETDDL